MRFLQTPRGVNAILAKFVINDPCAILGKELGQQFIAAEPQTLNALVKQILEGFLKQNKKTKQLSMKKMEDSQIGQKLAEELKKHPGFKSLSSKSGIYQFAKQLLLEQQNPSFITSSTDKETVVAKIIAGVKEEMDAAGEKYNDSMLNDYAKYLKNNIQDETLKGATTRELAAGTIGEQLLVDMMIDKQNVKINIVGGDSEEKVRKEIAEQIIGELGKEISSIREASKQSYSDMVLWVNQQPIRIQSKTYTQVMEIFNQKGRASDVRQRMRLNEDTSVIDFFTKIGQSGTQGTNMDDLQELAYSIANEIWFATAGDINYGTYPMSKNAIDAALTSIFVDYLGVIIDDDWNIQYNFSNIFFLLNGQFLVPTYLFLEGLRQTMLGGQDGLANMHAYLSYANIPTDKTKLYDDKMAVIKDLESGLNYPRELQVIGQSVGREILENAKIHIDAEASIQQLAKSSYNVLGDIEKYVVSRT